ncbi:uncharacterized protein [Physcomitrium patens]|uniref:Uncharacterized protein n=1 Tax=Physcomitrium patens TaxID=3218 RepID=A9SZA4_PHYPA|nr:uncharacterized protein LOC112287238 [Physcomitrium patens]PNR46674.1 hypothetical protein PHYPA_013794 [Physcomitrium patens]|eukprot:XP_024385827.1 uncharacterized protein LOC112287238 [Physcomitrella patens]
MASEIEWHKRSGKSVLDGFGRSLARRGLDILDMTGVTTLGEYQHSSRQLIDGVIRNRVEESLGAAKFEKICKQRTVLEHIHYCQSGLSFVNGFHNPHKVVPGSGVSALGEALAVASVLNHDYLVLELRCGRDCGETLFIRAEKSGHPPHQAGIILTVDPKFKETEESIRLFTIRCGDKEIGFQDILAILADHSPDYSLRDQNCWQYTRRTARRLLHRCKQLPDLSAEEIGRLQTEEDTMESRIATSHLRRVVNKGKREMKNLWSRTRG